MVVKLGVGVYCATLCRAARKWRTRLLVTMPFWAIHNLGLITSPPIFLPHIGDRYRTIYSSVQLIGKRPYNFYWWRFSGARATNFVRHVSNVVGCESVASSKLFLSVLRDFLARFQHVYQTIGIGTVILKSPRPSPMESGKSMPDHSSRLQARRQDCFQLLQPPQYLPTSDDNNLPSLSLIMFHLPFSGRDVQICHGVSNTEHLYKPNSLGQVPERSLLF